MCPDGLKLITFPCVLNSTILSYLLAYNVANLLNQLWLNFKIILPFFSNVSKAYREVGEMTGVQGGRIWVGR